MIKTIRKSKHKATIFVTRKSKIIRRGSYDIILSPEFYWVKKVSLPVKSPKAALKLAPSIFEGVLPKGEKFKFLARKAGEAYILIAYNPQKIEEELDEIFVSKGDVKNIYFAQDVLGDIDECTYVSEHAALTKLDDIIILVPRKCTDTTQSIVEKLDSIKLPNRSVKLSSYDSSEALISNRVLILSAIVIGLFAVANLIEFIAYKKELSKLEEQKEEIVKANHLPPTMFQIKSIKKRLTKEFEKQKSIREALYQLSKIALKNSEFIEDLELNPNNLTVTIHPLDERRKDEIKKQLQQKFKVKDISFDAGNLKAELAI